MSDQSGFVPCATLSGYTPWPDDEEWPRAAEVEALGRLASRLGAPFDPSASGVRLRLLTDRVGRPPTLGEIVRMGGGLMRTSTVLRPIARKGDVATRIANGWLLLARPPASDSLIRRAADLFDIDTIAAAVRALDDDCDEPPTDSNSARASTSVRRALADSIKRIDALDVNVQKLAEDVANADAALCLTRGPMQSDQLSGPSVVAAELNSIDAMVREGALSEEQADELRAEARKADAPPRRLASAVRGLALRSEYGVDQMFAASIALVQEQENHGRRQAQCNSERLRTVEIMLAVASALLAQEAVALQARQDDAKNAGQPWTQREATRRLWHPVSGALKDAGWTWRAIAELAYAPEWIALRKEPVEDQGEAVQRLESRTKKTHARA